MSVFSREPAHEREYKNRVSTEGAEAELIYSASNVSAPCD